MSRSDLAMSRELLLASPERMGSLDLPNRIVMAPMTRNRARMDGVPGELNALYYTDYPAFGAEA